jgi:Protein of unknown function (DUF3592)
MVDDPRFQAWIFIVAGIVGYFYGRKEKGRERLRVAEALGEVVKVETSRWKRWSSEEGSPVSVQFLAETGLRSTFTIKTKKKYEIGDRIPVVYEPQHPDNAGLQGRRSIDPRWYILISLLGIAALIFRLPRPGW